MCLNNYNNKYKSETWKVFPSVFPIPMTIFWPRSKILQQPVWWMWKKIMEACLIEAVPNKGKCKRRKKEIHFLFLLSSMAVIFNFVFSSYISLFIFNPLFLLHIHTLLNYYTKQKKLHIYYGRKYFNISYNEFCFVFLKSDLKNDITTVIIIDRCKFVNF